MEQKGLLLISGGVDSPVAGKILIDQGIKLTAVHFDLQPYTDDAPAKKCVQLARQLGINHLTIVPMGPAFAAASHVEHRLYFVLTKRMMIKAASDLAKKEGIPFLVTGENLGQVSSQTLTNLSVIDAASPIPVIRPLLAYDKEEIIDLSRKLGLFEVSSGPEVCDVLGPTHPKTRAKIRDVLREEETIMPQKHIDEALSKAVVHDF
ncbi:tRNA sulfurtransferase [uncultured archaeon]|nr:tRNA sulfurtransferase [uncultured archaeon]